MQNIFNILAVTISISQPGFMTKYVQKWYLSLVLTLIASKLAIEGMVYNVKNAISHEPIIFPRNKNERLHFL